MDTKKEAATRLAYYIKKGFEAKGYVWDTDNDGEIQEIVDLIVLAAVERVTKKVLDSLKIS